MRQLWKLVLIAVLLYGYFVWPTPYSYGTWTATSGFQYRMRVNRITRHIDIFYGPTGRWENLDDLQLNENERPYVINQ